MLFKFEASPLKFKKNYATLINQSILIEQFLCTKYHFECSLKKLKEQIRVLSTSEALTAVAPKLSDMVSRRFRRRY